MVAGCHSIYLEHYPTFTAKAANKPLTTSQRPVDHTYYLVRLVVIVVIISIIRERPFQYYNLVRIVLVKVHKRPHLCLWYSAGRGLIFRGNLAVIAKGCVGTTVIKEIDQRT